MNISLPYDEISFEEKLINKTYIQITITVCDKKAETSRIVFEKTMLFLLAMPLFVLLSILAFPVFFLMFIIEQISNLTADDTELSYEEAKKHFEEGNGYFNNLSEMDRHNLTKSIS